MQHSPAFLDLVKSVLPRIQELSVLDVDAKLKGLETFALIDVREESEWRNGHLVHAIHICKGVIERDVEHKLPDKSTEIVLYCGGGFRSVLAADNLQKMGYTRVWSMAGGFRGWCEAGLPIVKDS